MTDTPKTMAELIQLLDGGLFDETHYCEAKREIMATKAANKELARDLSSLAVDGGVLYVGIAEDGGSFSVAPQPLEGLAERIEQVARYRVSPPLSIRVETLESETRGHGVALVTIPVSPSSPHMVDHCYWGRGEKTKHALDDPEVSRLLQRRKEWEQSAHDLLDVEIARDPFGRPAITNGFPRGSGSSHVFIIAEPVGARPDGLLRQLSKDAPTNRLTKFVREARQPTLATTFSPTIREANQASLRAGGWGLHTSAISSGRLGGPDEDKALDLEIKENGGLRLFCGRLIESDEGGSSHFYLLEVIPLGLLCQVVSLSAAIGRLTNFYGNWDFGCALTNIRGASAFSRKFDLYGRTGPGFSEGEYRSTARATHGEVESTPGAIVDRVLGSLLRSLGVVRRDFEECLREEPDE